MGDAIRRGVTPMDGDFVFVWANSVIPKPQHVADAPNLPWAPSPVVRPGEPYRHHLEFRLTTDASEAS